MWLMCMTVVVLVSYSIISTSSSSNDASTVCPSEGNVYTILSRNHIV